MPGRIIYNAIIQLYRTGVALAAAMGNGKAALWLSGRRHWQEKMQQQLAGAGPLVWFHAASLGEFEQGRPVIEAIRQQYPGYKILLTFFSPSGYEVRKDYKGADFVYYLPLDTRRNARQFIQTAQPRLAIFIKYEFWYHFLTELYRQKVPVLLISGIFRPEQAFFKFYGGLFRRLLQQLTYIFVQDQLSLKLLQQAGISHTAIAGDTRFDRVWALQQETVSLERIPVFTAGRKTVIAGSTWPEDEQLLAAWWAQYARPDRCLILAPHEIGEEHIKQVETLFPGAVRYSALSVGQPLKETASVLIIDNIGLLSALYRYARVTFVGGGFGKEGIHNILEPATYGKPVLFGPVHHKYPEAAALLEAGGGASVKDLPALIQQMELLLEDDAACTQKGKLAGQYVAANKGATDKILLYIQEKRFLTSK